MKTIKILFYKAEWDGHLLDDLISLCTFPYNIGTPRYSHVELWLPSKDGYHLVLSDNKGVIGSKYLGDCYTSTMRGDLDGTVLRPASEVLTHPKRWDVSEEIEINEYQFHRLLRHIYNQVDNNKGYDKLCISDFFNPLRWWLPLHSKLKNICSEAVWNAVALAKGWLNKHILSPRRLSKRIIQRGIKIGKLVDM